MWGQRLKVAAVIGITITSGGGFNQALNAVRQMARLCDGKYEFVVYTSARENIPYLAGINIKAKLYRIGALDMVTAIFSTGVLTRIINNKLGLTGRFERQLLSDSVDLVYFVTPSIRSLALRRLNYITTVWDLAHRDTPEFPEVRDSNAYLSREFYYINTLSRAVCVLCDSPELCDKISLRYGIDKDRLLAMPFTPSRFKDSGTCSTRNAVMSKYNLMPGYFFYPAQFWAHKNHVRIVQAIAALKSKSVNVSATFCGGDQGSLKHVQETAQKLGVANQIRFLGFVPAEDILGLYQGCCAVVMPSYFGPTNLPPLEAWTIEKPLLYSSHLVSQTGSAALLFDPDSASELAAVMEEVLKPEVASNLIEIGKQRLIQLDQARERSERELLERLGVYNKRLECWKY